MQVNNISSQYRYNRKTNQRNLNRNNPSFQGGMQKPVINGLSKLYDGIAKTNPFQKFIKAFSKSDKTFAHLLFIESCILSGFYMINTLRNKKIEKEQKPQMLINDTLTLGISTAGAYFVEDKISEKVGKAVDKFFQNNKGKYVQLGEKAKQEAGSKLNSLLGEVSKLNYNEPENLQKGIETVMSTLGNDLKGIVKKGEQIDKELHISEQYADDIKTSVQKALENGGKVTETVKGLVDDVYGKVQTNSIIDKTKTGFNKLKILVIFGLIYRYLGPVVVTPLANKLSSKFFEGKKNKTGETQNKK